MTPCKGCGREIIWGTTAEGKKVPLDPKAPVYAISIKNGDTTLIRTALAMVTHYSVCNRAPEPNSAEKVTA